MNNNTPINLRIKFKKVGMLQYVSHLDLVRTMSKIVVRAKLPLWYTEGFNPKPKMVFAAPLSIGTESYVEFMDLRLSEKMDPAVAIKSLNDNLTDELVVLDAYYPETKHTDLKWLGYTITLSVSDASEELAEKCVASFAAEQVLVKKKERIGGKEVDIKPLIRSLEAKLSDGKIVIECVLSADASSFLNPEYVVKHLREAVGVLTADNIMSESYTILRHSAYREDMSPFV